MENETKNQALKLLRSGLTVAVLLASSVALYELSPRAETSSFEASPAGVENRRSLEEKVLPPQGVELPIIWGDLGARMIEAGVIDAEKFEALYSARGGMNEEERALLFGMANGRIKITAENSGILLNLFWALGLGNKNEILENGPMNDPGYGNPGVFASTGGWTLALGSVAEHYSRHPFITLTPEQQQTVERTSKNIYRPCCDNPAYFPDCNHGMAMLGLLELMAAEGVPEEEMYKAALQVNSYWFPDAYLTIAKYLDMKGVAWEKADPKEILGRSYSSFTGFQRVLSEVTPPEGTGGGSCGV